MTPEQLRGAMEALQFLNEHPIGAAAIGAEIVMGMTATDAILFLLNNTLGVPGHVLASTIAISSPHFTNIMKGRERLQMTEARQAAIVDAAREAAQYLDVALARRPKTGRAETAIAGHYRATARAWEKLATEAEADAA